MIKVLELFAGIGSQHQAFKNLGLDVEIVAISEIDKYALAIYEALHGKVNNLGDIAKIDVNNIPDCDIMTYSFPCQDLSIAGKQRGVDKDSGTRSSLLWECQKIIEKKLPKYLLMENVKNLVGATHKHNFDKWLQYLTSLGYRNYWKVLTATDYDIPQFRQRVFCVSIFGEENYIFPQGQRTTKVLKDIINNSDDNLQWFSNPFSLKREPQLSTNGLIQIGSIDDITFASRSRIYSINGFSPTLTTSHPPKIYIEGYGIRNLSPREYYLLMGFTNEQYEIAKNVKVNNKQISKAQLYKTGGNSIVIPCLEAIFKNIFIK